MGTSGNNYYNIGGGNGPKQPPEKNFKFSKDFYVAVSGEKGNDEVIKK